MARGWESKSVESQQEAGIDHSRRKLNADQVEQLRKREGLELSRLRVSNELRSATAPTRKASLEAALKHLDDELKKLG